MEPTHDGGAQGDDDAPIDFERLRDISADDPEMMFELVDMYMEQTAGFIGELRTAIADGDFETIRKISHKAVGGSSTCGMNRVVPFFRELERLGESRSGESVTSVLAQAEAAFERIRLYFEENKDRIFNITE